MKFEDVPEMSRTQAEAALSSNSPQDISRALVSLAYYDNDVDWVQNVCLRFIRHPSFDVVSSAVTCLGHLARIHRFLDLEKVMPILNELKSNPRLVGRVEDALDDIAMYVQESSSAKLRSTTRGLRAEEGD
jgi:hypothetical protein